MTAVTWGCVIALIGWLVEVGSMMIRGGAGRPEENEWLHRLAARTIFHVARFLGPTGSLAFAIACTIAGLVLALWLASRRPGE